MGLRRGRSGLEGSPHKQKGGCANPRKAIVTPLQPPPPTPTLFVSFFNRLPGYVSCQFKDLGEVLILFTNKLLFYKDPQDIQISWPN